VKREPRTEFTMDGSPHYTGLEDCCGLGVHKGCGGVIHRESVYGPSFIYECDGCDVCETGNGSMPETEDA